MGFRYSLSFLSKKYLFELTRAKRINLITTLEMNLYVRFFVAGNFPLCEQALIEFDSYQSQLSFVGTIPTKNSFQIQLQNHFFKQFFRDCSNFTMENVLVFKIVFSNFFKNCPSEKFLRGQRFLLRHMND